MKSNKFIQFGLIFMLSFLLPSAQGAQFEAISQDVNLDIEMEQWKPVANYEHDFANSLNTLDALSAEDPSDIYTLSNKEYWKTYWEDAKAVVRWPSEWDSRDWMIASAVVGGTIGLMIADEEINDWVQKNKSSTSQTISDAANVMGNPFLYIPALFASYLYGKKTGDVRLRRASLLALESLVLVQIANVPLKALTQRDRPKRGNGAWEFDGPTSFGLGPSSFVSGHSMAAFSVATIFSMEYRDKPWVAVASYGAATLISLQRIHDQHHWSSDVLMGAAIGTAIAYLVYKRAEARPDWIILPEIRPDFYGLRFNYDMDSRAAPIRRQE